MTNRSRFLSSICFLVLISTSPAVLLPQTTTDLAEMTTTPQFEVFIKTNAPQEDAFVAVQRLAKPFLDKKDWNGAIGVLEKYKPQFPAMEKRFDKIIELLKAPEQGLVTKNLGDGINSNCEEYLPSPSADGKYLYFTGYKRPDGLGGEDVFVSELKDGIWQTAINFGKNINTSFNESINSISADGNTMILFGNNLASFGKGDIFYTEKIQTGWSTIKHFPKPINSEFWDSDGSFTADGKAFLFSSQRSGCIGISHEKGNSFHGGYWGNIDIFVCIKTDSGWGEPINLGLAINTPYCEISPFLHPDGKTLYFSSDGHYGLGKLDIFKSIRLSDTSWTEWSEPMNLGKEINTAINDWGYKITTSGELAYFAAGSIGNTDIYSISLPKDAKPELAVISVSGKVTDEKGRFLDAEIKWENLETNENVGILKSNPQNGEYFIPLPVGKNYGYFAEKKGYYPISQNLDLRNETKSGEKRVDIVLVSSESIDSGKDVTVNNIFFDFNKFELQKESTAELERLAGFLREHDKLKVEISGHTDNVGGIEYNKTLSLNRAKAVVAYLTDVEKIARLRLKPAGYGAAKPVASNDTEEGRAQNRRVEFKILK